LKIQGQPDFFFNGMGVKFNIFEKSTKRKMLYFALRAFRFLITKHKNNNLLFSLTPLVLYLSLLLLILSSISLPSSLPINPHSLLFLSLISPHVFDLLTILASLLAPSLSLLLPSHSCSSLLVPTSATRYHFPLSHILFLLPIVLRFSYSLSSLLLFCVFVPLPFYSPSPCTFSRRVVFLFSPSFSKFSSVSPVLYPI
jgi:hypothetical protein